MDFKNFTKIKICWREIFEILSIHKPSLGDIYIICYVDEVNCWRLLIWSFRQFNVMIVINEKRAFFQLKTVVYIRTLKLFQFFNIKRYVPINIGIQWRILYRLCYELAIMKTVNGCKDDSIISLQKSEDGQVYSVCILIFLFY